MRLLRFLGFADGDTIRIIITRHIWRDASTFTTQDLPQQQYIIVPELRAIDPVEDWVDKRIGKREDNKPEMRQSVGIVEIQFAQHEAHSTR